MSYPIAPPRLGARRRATSDGAAALDDLDFTPNPSPTSTVSPSPNRPPTRATPSN